MTKKSVDVLTIGEVAKRSGASVPTIRFYEGKGLVYSTRTVGGTRMFPRHTLRRVSMVRLGVQFGIPLSDIATIFAELPTDRPPRATTGSASPTPGTPTWRAGSRR
ncbi:hypothetical protein GCM10025867_42890 [Frondihabitans sucicola]|uniref:HTH merR-type domain-containing protein n=1 Tax=Frondihabitans sucicola TaxID=1268041 RepID=A0ABN6Y4C1_9MICO|nr:MerR family transcriptional regulator [Frondihabitans sucicola]BDZ52048.1 hypothetical protein GCM10025867_42890 [Frondihabitans sucicola]